MFVVLLFGNSSLKGGKKKMEITKEDVQCVLQDIDSVIADVTYLAEMLPKVKVLLKQILEIDNITNDNELVKAYTDLTKNIDDNLKIIQL